MFKKERRVHPRRKFLKRLKYETVGAEVLNISDGGACIKAERAHEPGSVVKLRLPNPRLAEVRWANPTDGGKFKLGLKFFR
jgi:hypothetical protein